MTIMYTGMMSPMMILALVMNLAEAINLKQVLKISMQALMMQMQVLKAILNLWSTRLTETNV